MSMTTGDAMRLVSEFGQGRTESFMETIELMDIFHKFGLLSPKLSEAYLVTIGEMAEVAKMARSA